LKASVAGGKVIDGIGSVIGNYQPRPSLNKN
jgi:hypothetical protein